MHTRPVHVVLLAAGRSRRLAPFWTGRPKCLLEFGGQTLLSRHIDRIRTLGVSQMTIVTGYEARQLVDALPAVSGLEIHVVVNPRFEEGSIISLSCGLDTVPDGVDVVAMDADVLYELEVLRRIIDARGTGFLIDETQSETGEEMMLGVRNGRVMAIARSVSGESWDQSGETVGFFRVDAAIVAEFREYLNELIRSGHQCAEYEFAIDGFIQEHPAWAIPVGGLAWTEIDFAEDVQKANQVVLPRILQKDGEMVSGNR